MPDNELACPIHGPSVALRISLGNLDVNHGDLTRDCAGYLVDLDSERGGEGRNLATESLPEAGALQIPSCLKNNQQQTIRTLSGTIGEAHYDLVR